MFFIITALAAIISTIIWYKNAPEDKYMLNNLSLIYWGTTLMWFVDHVIAYLTEGGAFFEITLDATLLGITVVLLGLLVWLIILLVKDPKDVFNKVLQLKR